ncbi:MAG: aminodeoxychorismate lyase [Ectothiorhodospiraceae bacterium]|nr:aminodeoxychorismate lyase [Ectothiorhodospiraceae bacterium]
MTQSDAGMSPRRLVNGNPESAVDPADRGFLYGDGVFETIAVLEGRIPCWSEHWARLQRGAACLGLPEPREADFRQDVASLLNAGSVPDKAVLRLQYTAGPGGGGLRRPLSPQVTRVSAMLPFPLRPTACWLDGVHVHLCRTRLPEQPRLAGVKHCSRLDYVLARGEWADEDVAEGLMLDASGYVVEGTVSNLFAVQAGGLLTPALSRCGVHGIMRQEVLRRADRMGIPVEQGDYTLQRWLDSDELFLTNSLIGIWPIRMVAERQWRPGPITRRLQQALREDGFAMVPDTARREGSARC